MTAETVRDNLLGPTRMARDLGTLIFPWQELMTQRPTHRRSSIRTFLTRLTPYIQSSALGCIPGRVWVWRVGGPSPVNQLRDAELQRR